MLFASLLIYILAKVGMIDYFCGRLAVKRKDLLTNNKIKNGNKL
jgi:hypothetical protein